MLPSDISSALYYIADSIDEESSPSRISVSSDLNALIYLLEQSPNVRVSKGILDLFRRKPKPEVQKLYKFIDDCESYIDYLERSKDYLSSFKWEKNYGKLPNDIAESIYHVYGPNLGGHFSYPMTFSPIGDIMRWDSIDKVIDGWEGWCEYMRGSHHYFDGDKLNKKNVSQELGPVLRTFDSSIRFLEDQIKAAEEKIEHLGAKPKKHSPKPKLKPFPDEVPDLEDVEKEAKPEAKPKEKPVQKDPGKPKAPSKSKFKSRKEMEEESEYEEDDILDPTGEFSNRDIRMFADFFDTNKNPPQEISEDFVTYLADNVSDDVIIYFMRSKPPKYYKFLDKEKYLEFKVSDVRSLRRRWQNAKENLEYAKSYDKTGKYIGRQSFKKLRRKLLVSRISYDS